MGARKAASRLKKETNPTVIKKLSRLNLRCPLCPPNRGENAGRRPTHGKTKPKRKDHRRSG